MPKTKRPPLPADELPIWDALVAELGDPRPHEPSTVDPSYVVPDDAFADCTDEHATGLADVDWQYDDVVTVLDDLDEDAQTALDGVWTPPRPPVAVVPVTDVTAFLPVNAVLSVGEITVELPIVTEDPS